MPMGELCIQGFCLNVDGRWPIAEPTSHTFKSRPLLFLNVSIRILNTNSVFAIHKVVVKEQEYTP